MEIRRRHIRLRSYFSNARNEDDRSTHEVYFEHHPDLAVQENQIAASALARLRIYALTEHTTESGIPPISEQTMRVLPTLFSDTYSIPQIGARRVGLNNDQQVTALKVNKAYLQLLGLGLRFVHAMRPEQMADTPEADEVKYAEARLIGPMLLTLNEAVKPLPVLMIQKELEPDLDEYF